MFKILGGNSCYSCNRVLSIFQTFNCYDFLSLLRGFSTQNGSFMDNTVRLMYININLETCC